MPSLDGVRGIAIIAVFVFHYGIGVNTNGPLYLARLMAHFGWTGVDLFFVLSGFLITGILYDTRNDENYFSHFYARRALRLFPLVFGIAAILLLLTPLLHLQWKIGHLAFLFYGANIAGYVDPMLNGIPPYFVLSHLWSLAVEEQFYLLWPLLIYFIPNRLRLMKACLIIIGLALFLRTALYFSHIVQPSFLYSEMPCRMDSLAIGGLISLLFRGEENKRLRHLGPILLAGGLISVLTIILIVHSVDWRSPLMLTIGFTCISLICGGFILITLREGSPFNRLCSMKFLRRCGEYSYGIYVYHLLVKPVLQPQLRFYVAICHSAVAGEFLWIIHSFLVIFMVSAISFHFYEQRWMRLKSRFPYETPIKTIGVVKVSLVDAECHTN